MEKMTIHRGLTELKLIDSKIDKQTNEINPIGLIRKDGLVNGNTSIENFQSSAQSKIDSIFDLIRRKSDIKSAIMDSNSKTKVSVSGRDMTVAEAINHKSIILQKKNLLCHLKQKNNLALLDLERKNQVVEADLQKILEATFGKENVKVTESDFDNVRIPYLNSKEYKLFDPISINSVIQSLEAEIESFEAEVDAVLSESNAITIISF